MTPSFLKDLSLLSATTIHVFASPLSPGRQRDNIMPWWRKNNRIRTVIHLIGGSKGNGGQTGMARFISQCLGRGFLRRADRFPFV